MISVIVKKPKEPIQHVEIDNTLESLQEIVGGYIETVTMPDKIVIICDEEARIIAKPYNCNFMGVSFVGTIICTTIDNTHNFTSLTEKQRRILDVYLQEF